MTHSIDAAQLLHFVQLLEKYPNETHVRAFPPNGGIHTDLGARVGVLDRDLDRIQQWNQEGRGIYVVINNGGNNDANFGVITAQLAQKEATLLSHAAVRDMKAADFRPPTSSASSKKRRYGRCCVHTRDTRTAPP